MPLADRPLHSQHISPLVCSDTLQWRCGEPRCAVGPTGALVTTISDDLGSSLIYNALPCGHAGLVMWDPRLSEDPRAKPLFVELQQPSCAPVS